MVRLGSRFGLACLDLHPERYPHYYQHGRRTVGICQQPYAYGHMVILGGGLFLVREVPLQHGRHASFQKMKLGSRVQGLGFRVWYVGFMVQCQVLSV